ncbi:MAG TPA: Fur family transcriptional regulator [Oscillospiraceae bacterium]|nr:Fur family transcriptional regulator [Oscillospiraceae bacterium]HPS34322.1 Fur family transcriptional regulator [Oscillospiraceae bacterium]
MEEHLKTLIQKSGLKNTRHRAVILELLEQNDQPSTAEQLYSEMIAKSIPINLSTVYRTLDTLCEKELITKLTIEGGNKALFEFNSNLHRHHLICLGCKKIMALENCPLGDYEQTLENKTHFVITSHKLDIYGYCPDCRFRKKPST